MLALCFICLFERPFDDKHFDIWFNGPRSNRIETVALFKQHTCTDNDSLKKKLPVKGLTSVRNMTGTLMKLFFSFIFTTIFAYAKREFRNVWGVEAVDPSFLSSVDQM